MGGLEKKQNPIAQTARSFFVECSQPCHLEDDIEDEIDEIVEWVIENTTTWNIYRDLSLNSAQLSWEYFPRYYEDWQFHWFPHYRYPFVCRSVAFVVFTFESHSDQVQFLLRWRPPDA